MKKWPLAIALTLSCAPTAFAQNNDVPQRLDELIPEAAVEDPEQWAADEDQATEPDAEVPDPALDFTEQEDLFEAEAVDQLEDELTAARNSADDAVDAAGEDFAELEVLSLPPRMQFDDVVDIDGRLTLAFPTGSDGFSQRRAFVQKFRSFSTIEKLENGEGNLAQLGARARADQRLLETLLRTYGYYDGEVVRSLAVLDAGENGSRANGNAKAQFLIIPGAQYTYGEIDLGSLRSAPDYDELLGTFGISSGDAINSELIVARRFALDDALGEGGYPFAQIGEPELLIDHAMATGDLRMPVEPGGNFVFSEIRSSEPDFLSGRHLQRIARFDPGDTYQRSLEQDLRRAVLATGLVSSLTIEKRVDSQPTEDAPGEVALDVTLEKAKLRTIAGAVGFGTEDGLKLQASWEHRNFFPPEGALKFRGILGTREQLLGAGYKRNNWKRRDQVLTIDAYASDVATESVEARTVALRTAIERVSNLLFQKPFSWAAGAEFLLSDERNRVTSGIPRPRRTYRVGSLFGRATIDGSDSLLDPSTGYRVSFFAAPEISNTQGSTAYYLRAQADATVYQPAGENVVMAGRARFATIQGAETFQIAPSRRLYSGGGGSVRGYGYQAIGPRNDFGEATGGRSLVELSAEARIDTPFFDGALQVVPFFDLGAVSIDTAPDFRFVKYGAGVGVRYKTGFGPIRVDLGVPLNPDPQDSAFAVYVSLGQAF